MSLAARCGFMTSVIRFFLRGICDLYGPVVFVMYGGRIGGLSLVLVFGQRKPEAPVKRPTEQILIG